MGNESMFDQTKGMEFSMRNVSVLLLVCVLSCPAYSQEIQKPGRVPVTKPDAPLHTLDVKPRSVSLDKQSVYLLLGGAPARLAAAVLPAEAQNKTVKWESTNPQVAAVDGSGTVTPMGVGTCKVIVSTLEGGGRAACDVMVDAPNTAGNTPGNGLNNGYLARQGNWVYYANPYDGMKLYKSRLIGTEERIKLSDDSVSGINVVGEWIYYVNRSRSYRLYKMRIDGTGAQCLSDVDNLNRSVRTRPHVFVMDGRIYYHSDSLRSISLEGMNRQKLSDETNIQYFAPSGEWIYFSKSGDMEEGLFRMRRDGTGKVRVYDRKIRGLTVDGDFVYIINAETGGIIKVAPEKDYGSYAYAKNINADNQAIYWCNLSGAIVKSRSDLKRVDTLVSFEGNPVGKKDKIVFTAENWIFYYTLYESGRPDGLYMVRADGIGHREFR